MISVILTCHNEERFIAQAIESVVAQTVYDEIGQIIVANDGSRDGSQAVLDEISVHNGKLEIIQTGGVGVSAARNIAIARAHGDFIAFLDGDDLWHPEKMERQLAAARVAGESTVLLYTDFLDFCESINEGRHVPVRIFEATNRYVLDDFFVYDGPIMPSSVLVRTRAIKETKGFDPTLKYAEDTDAWLRLAAAGGRFQHVPGVLTFKRRHGANATGDPRDWDASAERISEIWVDRVPELASLRSRRASVRRVKIASTYLSRGEKARAFTYLARALACNPLNGRAYVFVGLALLPNDVRRASISMLKRLRSMARHSGLVKAR